MATTTIVFEGDSLTALEAAVRRWLGDRQALVPTPVPAAGGEAEFSWNTPRFREVLDWTGGDHSRRFLVELARSVLAGERLHNTDELQQRYGVRTGIAFAGVVGGINKRMKNQFGRNLVHGRWEGDHSSWTMDDEAAQVIIDLWG